MESNELQEKNESLEVENAELRARLEKLEGERESAKKLGWLGAKVFVGPELRKTFRSWTRAAAGGKVPVDETADVGAAVVRRVVRVSLIGISVALLPTAMFFWQNWEIRKQSGLFGEQIQKQTNQHSLSMQAQTRQLEQQKAQLKQQKSDTLIVRRAQLLTTIYDCAEEQPEVGDDDYAPVSCKPKAHLRARDEAVKAFVKIERESLFLNGARSSRDNPNLRGGYPIGAHLSGAKLNGADLSNADLRDANLRGADLLQADLRKANLRGADLRDGDLETALGDLETALGLTQGQIDVARVNSETKLPEELELKLPDRNTKTGLLEEK